MKIFGNLKCLPEFIVFTWNPHHRAQRQEDTNNFGAFRISIIIAIGWSVKRVTEKDEYTLKSTKNNGWLIYITQHKNVCFKRF